MNEKAKLSDLTQIPLYLLQSLPGKVMMADSFPEDKAE